MLTIAQAKQGTQLQIATIQGIRDELKNDQIKMHNENILTLIDLYSEKAAATLLAEKAESKEFLERGFNSITVKNGKGEQHTVPGGLAPTAAEGAEVRKIRRQTIVINGFLDKMENLYKNENNWLPAAVDESTALLKQTYNELKLQVKVIKNMGANFTVPEIAMIDATIPTDSIIDKAKNGLIKISNLRDIYISEQYAIMESFGLKGMPKAADKRKLGPGMQAGVSN
jgi:hypothetical protein